MDTTEKRLIIAKASGYADAVEDLKLMASEFYGNDAVTANLLTLKLAESAKIKIDNALGATK